MQRQAEQIVGASPLRSAGQPCVVSHQRDEATAHEAYKKAYELCTHSG